MNGAVTIITSIGTAIAGLFVGVFGKERILGFLSGLKINLEEVARFLKKATSKKESGKPLEIIKLTFAKGEVSEDEFLEMCHVLVEISWQRAHLINENDHRNIIYSIFHLYLFPMGQNRRILDFIFPCL